MPNPFLFWFPWLAGLSMIRMAPEFLQQDINPWRFFLEGASSQFGLINVNLGKTEKPEMEKEIVSEVASYGRQLGKLMDAVEMLLKRADDSAWDETERRLKREVLELAAEINARKAGFRSVAAMETALRSAGIAIERPGALPHH